jgi:hypothetical protein
MIFIRMIVETIICAPVKMNIFPFRLFFFVFINMTRKSGSTASSPSTSFDNGASTPRFVCSMCAKVYRSGAGLRYHKRKRHRGKYS